MNHCWWTSFRPCALCVIAALGMTIFLFNERSYARALHSAEAGQSKPVLSCDSASIQTGCNAHCEARCCAATPEKDKDGSQQPGHDMGQMGQDQAGHASHSGHDMGQMNQDHSGHDMGQMNQDHSGHDMSQMNHDHSGHTMTGAMNGGPFMSMAALGSGTSLAPASSPMNMWHWMISDWMLMVHGNLDVGFDSQGGPRGVDKAESENWLMVMANHQVEGGGLFTFRGMFSAEPGTAPNGGFPELFQTGETFHGRPIVDAQHPHNLFMELAASLTMPLSEHVSVYIYGGPVGEPALGPEAFMHRASGSEDPTAPLGHHWEDSTHISEGVFTTGLTAWRFRVEGSIFRGEEPDEDRTAIETGKLDSYSARIWFTPTPDWAFQVSTGRLHHPELLDPGNLTRTTASASYNRPWRNGNWATSLIWGRNHEVTGNSNAYLLESTLNFLDKNYAYTRLELVDKDGLDLENEWGRAGLPPELIPVSSGAVIPPPQVPTFRVGAFTFGGVRDIITDPRLRVGIGADVTFYDVPDALKPIYGSNPKSYHVFVRIRPGKMEH